MTTYIIRASHANIYELQNYEPIIKSADLRLITSLHPLTPTPLPTLKLPSPTDLPRFPLRRQLLNRLLGGEQWLLGLEKVVRPSDILHTAETYTPYTHQAVRLRQHNLIKKLVCTCWETIPHSNEKFWRLKQWKKAAHHYVDLFHTPTKRAKQALIAEGVDPRKIKVIPYGVNLAAYAPRPKRRTATRPLVLTVARRVPEKGLAIFDAVKQQLGQLADFRWVSAEPYQQLPALYQQADIFFLPSLTTPTWEEQYGMVLVEALAAGLPIVTSHSGAIPEVVGEAAILSASDTAASYAKILTQLIRDQKTYAHYQKLALARAPIYNRDNLAKKLAQLYQ